MTSQSCSWYFSRYNSRINSVIIFYFVFLSQNKKYIYIFSKKNCHLERAIIFHQHGHRHKVTTIIDRTWTKSNAVWKLTDRLQSCWWHCDVGDLEFKTILECWRQNKDLVTSCECWCPTLVLRDRGCWWPKWPKPSPTS